MSIDLFHQGPSMGEIIASAFQFGGDRVAFIHGDAELSFRQCGDLISRIIQALEARGLKKGDSVATLSANRPEAYLMQAASHVAGFRITLINPNASEDDHALILETAGVRALFVDPPNFGDRARRLKARVPGLEMCFGLGPFEGFDDLLDVAQSFEAKPLQPCANSDDECLVVFSGGTTGKPKGVSHRHGVQVTMTLLQMADWDWPKEVRYLVMSPITHGGGAFITSTLLRGGTVVTHQGFSPDRFVDLVQRHRITATFLVPTMVYALLEHPRARAADLSSLELIAYGAAPMLASRLAEAIERFGSIFMQIYGQSEVPMCITVMRRDDHDPVKYPQRLSSCGRPMFGAQLKLLDDAGREVTGDEVGEICLRGPLVTHGYIDNPEETAQAWRDGWLYTGDRARRDADGFLYIVDRSKDMVITGGFNVYPREVEDAIAGHAGVQAVAVFGLPDPKWGEAVTAAVVRRPGVVVDAAELIALVKERKGPVYAPKAIHFIDQLPVTGLGKLDKKALRAQFKPQ
ncbi:AMP-binding protein [Ramlibacter sp. WS9]|uniref:AMP-binding protein n=1 Tax=Ramlibacter sp. WS9 TaxID=1882741 RepID=UPI0011419F21|nr:AMP-binding protein [Ramlibacter sp. WS9]ROZ68734.1 acyl-CoA synthetase [Ramlibacter sp. WS9]